MLFGGVAAGVGTEVNTEEVGQKILAYLQATHRYSLSPGGFEEGDPVVQWLGDQRPGHCELFAGAFTLLARTAGIPTRMVVGFSGGSWNSFEDFFVVRNRNAHAWCEIFDGKEWVRFDPTPGGAGGRGSMAGTQGLRGFASESDFSAWVDSLRVMWYRQVINFDDSSQEELIEDLSGVFRELGDFLREFFVALGQVLSEAAQVIFSTLRESAVAALAFVALIVSIPFLYRGTGVLWLNLQGSGVADPLRRRAGRELQRLEDSLIEGHEQEVKREELKDRLLEVRYGPFPDPSRAFRLFRESKRFRRRKV